MTDITEFPIPTVPLVIGAPGGVAAFDSSVSSVNGQSGTVTITKASIGLSNVDNTSDADKPLSTAVSSAISGKQATLVSAVNIKTVNGESLLGSGGIVIAGGGGVSSVAGRTGAVTLTKSDVDLNNVDNTTDANKPVSTAVQSALDLKVSSALLAIANGVATLGADGKIPSSQLASIATGETFVVADQVARLGLLSAVKGDVAVQIDTNESYILSVNTPTVNASWIKLLFPATVSSVAGKTGAVSLMKTDIGLPNIDDTSDADKPISTATQAALNGKLDKSTYTAKGVIAVATSANAAVAVPVGSNNQVLTADSAQPSGVKWATPAASASGAEFGDTKFGYQTADHAGWIILDGRAASTLTAEQQAVATSLGFGANIPDTRGKFPLAASATAISGTSGGSNTIARSGLPNFTLTGATGNESTSHVHVVNAFNATGTTTSVAATNPTETNVIAFSPARTPISDNGAALGGTTDNSYMALAGADRAIVSSDTSHSHSITLTIPTHTSQANSPGHTHSYTTSSINGGVIQTAHLPAYSSKTEFVYLGL